MVAIAHGKGVIKCHHYNGNINAETFADFVKEHFPEMFTAGNNNKGRLFLQDGIDAIPCWRFKIPARSPDLNLIEKVFHLVGNQLRKDAIGKNISKETFEQRCWLLKKVYWIFLQLSYQRQQSLWTKVWMVSLHRKERKQSIKEIIFISFLVALFPIFCS